MAQNSPNNATVAIPERLAVVFSKLRRGRHISRQDAEDFQDLSQNRDAYTLLLHNLGYELVCHPQEFFYVEGNAQVLGERLRAVTLFMLILFQHLEDNKFREAARAWERTLLERPFDVSELPHFTTSAPRRALMERVGVTADALHKKVLRQLEQWGMLDFVSQGKFYFRSPVYRFVDLCEQYATQGLPTEVPVEPASLAQDTNGEADAAGDSDGDAQ